MAPQQQPFERLIRFETDSGKTHYGDWPLSDGHDGLIGKEVNVIAGDLHQGFSKTSTKATVRKLLAPLPSVPIFECIGLNYKHHAAEANLTIPEQPVVFTKPPSAQAGPEDKIYIHPKVQQKLDYEGELTVIIAKDAKNVSADNALDYVLGFTMGNDVSARDYQAPATVSGGQFGYAKSFDGFGPFGPAITSTAAIGDPQNINYTTKVNGELRQKTSTSDMYWSVKKLIEHLSLGTTLQAGTAIMTGTPSGVAAFMKPPVFLKDGDVVEIEADKIGKLRNTIVFDK